MVLRALCAIASPVRPLPRDLIGQIVYAEDIVAERPHKV